jgi:tetratricopeptide (TPR) repeat protein
MKKLVFASAMALAGMSLVSATALRAQGGSDQITIQNPAEFNAYQQASTQTDPAAKAAALEQFLTAYPQSVVKKTVLDELMDTYQGLGDANKALSAASRLLQIDPNNIKAIFLSVFLDKNACQKAVDPKTDNLTDPQPCDNAAVLAGKGLTAPKPDGMSDADWAKMSGALYPAFDSAIALDDVLSKKDYAAAVDEYTKELMLYPADATKSGAALGDTLSLAEVLAKPSDKKDLVKAIWFYARAWNFAPPAYKSQIEEKLDYWYKRYHGTLDGADAIKSQIDAIKAQAATSLFPPASFTIKPAPTPAEIVDNVIATTPDLTKLNLEDKEFVLSNGSADAQAKLWAVVKGQLTPVPGIVISDQATALKVSITTAKEVKPKEYVVKLTTPADCTAALAAVPAGATVKDAQAYILANGVKADTDAVGDDLTTGPPAVKKIVIEPAVTTINVAVTQDAKDNKAADFIVNMKDPASCKDVPGPGEELKLQPAEELDGTYDTYTQIPAAGGKEATAQIVLSGGFLQQEAKAAPVHHKPSPAHHTAH